MSETTPDDSYFPTVDDLRVAAKVARYMANMLETEERAWPWWKRKIMEYPSRQYYAQFSIKLDTIADKYQNNQASI